MKLKQIKNFKNKLIKLKLIETKIFQKNFENSITLKEIIFRLKKCLSIIYKYHINNKRILFVGIPFMFLKDFKKFIGLKHIYVPSSIWLNGIITNQKSCLKYLNNNHKLINKKYLNIFYKFNTKIDLIVILDNRFKESVINESYEANVPIICIDCPLKISNYKIDYKIPGNFRFSKKKIRNDFFFSILLSTIKKALNLKNKNVIQTKKK